MPFATETPFKDKDQRADERSRKRETVLLAAVRMFNERGFHAASLDDVAASIGVSKPTIYHYLGNKEQVLLECITRGMEQLDAAVADAERTPGTGLDRLKVCLALYGELNMNEFGRCIIRTSDNMLSAEGAERFRALKRKIDGAIRKLVAAAIADGSAAPSDVRLTTFTLASALNGPGLWYDPDGPLSARAIAEATVATLVAGIAPR